MTSTWPPKHLWDLREDHRTPNRGWPCGGIDYSGILQSAKLTRRLQHYLQEMAHRVEQIGDADDRAAAAESLDWCQEYTAQRDPFAKPIRQPKVKEPRYFEIQEFRKRLGFHTGFW